MAVADPPSEKLVFVAAGPGRQRAVRLAGLAAVAVTGAWLVALIGGTLGLGRVPLVPLPAIGAMQKPSDDGASKGQDGAKRIVGRAPSVPVAGPGGPEGAQRGSREQATRRPSGKAGASPQSITNGASTSTPSATSPPPAARPTGREHAPSQTPSGNIVPTGTTGPAAAPGQALDPPGTRTRSLGGR
jgi:hypothetical protein